jgi:hypothetical protein
VKAGGKQNFDPEDGGDMSEPQILMMALVLQGRTGHFTHAPTGPIITVMQNTYLLQSG